MEAELKADIGGVAEGGIKKSKGKKNKKGVKKRKSVVKSENKGEKTAARDSALDYLRTWKKDRDNWKFQKLRQVWLLQNMYDTSLVPHKSFRTLLKYLKNLRGKARIKAVEDAMKIVQCGETEENEESIERARKIVQYLE